MKTSTELYVALLNDHERVNIRHHKKRHLHKMSRTRQTLVHKRTLTELWQLLSIYLADVSETVSALNMANWVALRRPAQSLFLVRSKGRQWKIVGSYGL